jgi:hypothetical protein
MNVYSKCANPYIDKNGIARSCGQCLSCRKAKTLEWVIRCKHECIENDKSMFITLTYAPKHLKRTAYKKMNGFDMRGTLDPDDVTLFLKRLRKWVYKKWGKERKVRYIYCGEY